MKVTVEEINGRKCTVIRKPFDAEYVRGQLGMGNTVSATISNLGVTGLGGRTTILSEYVKNPELYRDEADFNVIDLDENGWPVRDSLRAGHFTDTIVILPALPRWLEPKDAPLLYRYMAEGLIVAGEEDEYSDAAFRGEIIGFNRFRNAWALGDWDLVDSIRITHALISGNRVDIAIEDSKKVAA